MRSRQAVGMMAALAVVLGMALPCEARSELGPPDQVDAWLAKTNLHPAIEKLGRGGANVLTGWMEVPLNVTARYNPNSPTTAASSTLTGIGIGALKGLARTGIGAYEILTFWLPIPEAFAPILPPLQRPECVGDQRKAACP